MDEQTIKTYNLLAQDYDDETAYFWDNFPRGFFDKFVSMAKGKVLDVGSGPGRDGLILKEKGADIVCLDASEVMIKLCKEKGLEGVVGDFISMPFEDNSFDAVWAYTSLLHVPKSEVPKAFDEIKRVLKQGGVLGLGMIEGDQELYRESSGVGMPRWFSFYTKKELEKLLEDHGFEILHFESFDPNKRKNYLNYIARKK